MTLPKRLTDNPHMTQWKIVGEPEEDLLPQGGKDAVTWTWVIERDGERRSITIAMSRTLFAAGDISDDAARARDTKGRNYVEAVLEKDDPPRFRKADTTHSLIDMLVDTYE